METHAPAPPIAAQPDAGERHITAPQPPARKRGRPAKAWVPSPGAPQSEAPEPQHPQAGWEDAADWGLVFDATYRRKSRERQRRRKRPRKALTEAQIASRKARDEEARASLAVKYKRARQNLPAEQQEHTPTPGQLFCFAAPIRHQDRDAALVYNAECEAENLRIRRLKMAERKARERDRLSRGFVFPGGPIDGTQGPALPTFVEPGLRSEQHSILRLFVTKLPKGRGIVCGETKEQAYEAPYRSKLLGCDSRYVEGLKTMRGFLRVDVDGDTTAEHLAAACQRLGLPPPNIVVGWRFPQSDILRNPHLIWMLKDSVGFTQKHKRRFQMLFYGVLNGLTAALLPYGADPGARSNCMRVKNPLCPVWHYEILAEAPYSLKELRQCVNTRIECPETGRGPIIPDCPVGTRATDSNFLFRALAHWARMNVRIARDEEGVDVEVWLQRVQAYAAEKAHELIASTWSGTERRLSNALKRAMQLAVKVARWNWDNVPAASRASSAMPLPAEEIARRQASAGRETGAKRRAASAAMIIAAAVALESQGHVVGQAAVQAALERQGCRRSRSTIRRHWLDVEAALSAERAKHSPC